MTLALAVNLTTLALLVGLLVLLLILRRVNHKFIAAQDEINRLTTERLEYLERAK